MRPSRAWRLHMCAHVSEELLMFRIKGPWHRICAPVWRMSRIASWVAGTSSSLGWLKCAWIASCLPDATTSEKRLRTSFASGSSK
ncbi:hypothetical protein BDV38DRAFT_240148 [Aspergillus pseudotamarii]|uniref:Uncharacterized protein n=1 Tax=Aspergillus pseudotamarii TaxID=132259 RepID=A0A5N6T1B7_ASPPS|nr:uncharacterized protein BDV38DRAFT_240148 [Aspergillus pseudotamarii]KAE8140170.1 hypothetical protein BDV38DRAFT_240148 [Aspergillus pseudotamarii]